jgi:hypothetical protein
MPDRWGNGPAWTGWAVVATLALAAPAPALAQEPGTTPEEAIAALNAQRAAHGIPGDLVENPELSLGCQMHMAYEAVHGRSPVQPHAEDPAKPGYTALGDLAARSSVLAGRWSSWAAGNPWEDAPIHLMDTLAPALVQTGWYPGCMWTAPTVPRPAPPTPRVFTYPGPGATIYPQQAAYESPFVPGDFVGLPMGTVTGPHLLVMPFGQAPGLGPDESSGPTRVVAASLAGPSGLVEVRSVDQSTVGPRGNLGAYLEGAILIPATPLAPASTYRARVALLYRGIHPLDVSWTFRTAGHADALPIRPRVQVTGIMRTPNQVRVTLTGGEAAGRLARISTLRLGRTCAFCRVAPVGEPRVRRVTLRETQTITLPRVRHGHRLVVIARGFRAAGVRYARVRLTKVIR